MSHLGDNIGKITLTNSELINIITKDEVLSAFAIAYDVGQKVTSGVADSVKASQKIMDDIVGFRCYQSLCHTAREIAEEIGGAATDADVMKVLLTRLSDLAELHKTNKMTADAYQDIAKVTADLGSKSLNFQRGAAHVLNDVQRLARKLANDTDDFVIEAFEKVVDIGDGAAHGTRKYDVTIRVGDIIYHVEMKSWEPSRFNKFMTHSLNGLKKFTGNTDDLVDVVPGQMSKDLIDALKQVDLTEAGGVININRGLIDSVMTKRWRFDSRMAGRSADDLADEVTDIIKSNPDMARQLLVKSGVDSGVIKDLSVADLSAFVDNILFPVLKKMFVV